MIVRLDTHRLQTLDQVREFLDGSEQVPRPWIRRGSLRRLTRWPTSFGRTDATIKGLSPVRVVRVAAVHRGVRQPVVRMASAGNRQRSPKNKARAAPRPRLSSARATPRRGQPRSRTARDRDQLRVSDVQASTQHAMRQTDDSEHVVLSVVSSEPAFS